MARPRPRVTIPGGVQSYISRNILNVRKTSYYQRIVNESRRSIGQALVDDKAAEAIAREAASFIRRVVYRQRYDWVDLNPQYLESKRKENKDTRTLISTREYVESIRAWRDPRGYWNFGIHPDDKHEESGLPMERLARIHEFGTSSIPARPLWRPFWYEFRQILPDDVFRVVRKENTTKFRLNKRPGRVL